HDDMVGELLLDAGHAPFLPTALEDDSIGRADEDEEDQDADRGDDHGFDQSRLAAHRHDVAVSGRRDRDHRKIDDVEETDVPVDLVDQPIAVEPVDQHHDRDEQQGRAEPQAHVAPSWNADQAAQGSEPAGADRLGRTLPPGRYPRHASAAPPHSEYRSARLSIDG